MFVSPLACWWGMELWPAGCCGVAAAAARGWLPQPAVVVALGEAVAAHHPTISSWTYANDCERRWVCAADAPGAVREGGSEGGRTGQITATSGPGWARSHHLRAWPPSPQGPGGHGAVTSGPGHRLLRAWVGTQPSPQGLATVTSGPQLAHSRHLRAWVGTEPSPQA